MAGQFNQLPIKHGPLAHAATVAVARAVRNGHLTEAEANQALPWPTLPLFENYLGDLEPQAGGEHAFALRNPVVIQYHLDHNNPAPIIAAGPDLLDLALRSTSLATDLTNLRRSLEIAIRTNNQEIIDRLLATELLNTTDGQSYALRIAFEEGDIALIRRLAFRCPQALEETLFYLERHLGQEMAQNLANSCPQELKTLIVARACHEETLPAARRLASFSEEAWGLALFEAHHQVRPLTAERVAEGAPVNVLRHALASALSQPHFLIIAEKLERTYPKAIPGAITLAWEQQNQDGARQLATKHPLALAQALFIAEETGNERLIVELITNFQEVITQAILSAAAEGKEELVLRIARSALPDSLGRAIVTAHTGGELALAARLVEITPPQAIGRALFSAFGPEDGHEELREHLLRLASPEAQALSVQIAHQEESLDVRTELFNHISLDALIYLCTHFRDLIDIIPEQRIIFVVDSLFQAGRLKEFIQIAPPEAITRALFTAIGLEDGHEELREHLLRLAPPKALAMAIQHAMIYQNKMIKDHLIKYADPKTLAYLLIYLVDSYSIHVSEYISSLVREIPTENFVKSLFIIWEIKDLFALQMIIKELTNFYYVSLSKETPQTVALGEFAYSILSQLLIYGLITKQASLVSSIQIDAGHYVIFNTICDLHTTGQTEIASQLIKMTSPILIEIGMELDSKLRPDRDALRKELFPEIS